MNINDEQFKNFIKNSNDTIFKSDAIALRFAGILADIVKHKASSADRELWDSVPEISADAKRGDIVKDYSIRHHHKDWKSDIGGQVGVVTGVREIRKRDGRTAVEVEILFFNHTVLNARDYKSRKLQFIKG